jgi:beta-barrel assembly-enhancing protease
MFKAGYDPNAFVSFFEKIEAEEKRRPGTVSTLFETHPPTPDRVTAIQKEIATILPQRESYVVTTSEFEAVKARLFQIENRGKLLDASNKQGTPTLHTRTETQGSGQVNSPATRSSSPSDQSPSEDPDRPKLKRTGS